MEPIGPQDQQQKGFLVLFPELTGDSHLSTQEIYQNPLIGTMQNQRHPASFSNITVSPTTAFNPPLDLMAMSGIMSLQGLDSNQASLSSTPAFTPQILLEQQYKLSQLQQLQQLQNQIQNQIFQQQLALISGHTNIAAHDTNTETHREQVPPVPFDGLPTPLSSAELRPMPDSDFLSRLDQSFANTQREIYTSQTLDNIPLPSPQESVEINHYLRHQGTASAPANIAFHMSPTYPLPSPSDLDISPLTSPWLQASQQQPSHVRSPSKRTASPIPEDSRKRVTPLPPAPVAPRKPPRNVKSATSTPLLRSSRCRRNSILADNDSPSPVDLSMSMPPPAPPAVGSSPASCGSASSPVMNLQEDAHITPVTPASIMNLGRLGLSSSLAPNVQGSRGLKQEKVKEPMKHKAPADTSFSAKTPRKGALPLISPGPKPILPAGSPTSLNLGSSALPQSIPQTRKSHKDAEQKRRDSLKTAYDDLRTLLPPVPLPSDENFLDEPILPGALPPRGPPKAGGDGPNKGVSKLQLLRCGNDYIKRLKERVDRRDKEIANLRKEVLRLRTLTGDEGLIGEEPIDLEKDLDAVEIGNKPLGQSLGVGGEDDGDDGDD